MAETAKLDSLKLNIMTREQYDAAKTAGTIDENQIYMIEGNDSEEGYLLISGGTLTGALILFGDPTSELEAVTKRYADVIKGLAEAAQATADEAISSIPTNISELTNDSGFTTNAGTITGVSANGTSIATSGVANIPAASTSKYGVTKLSNSTSSTSTTLAATANAVKTAYGRAESAYSIATDAQDHAQNLANAMVYRYGDTMEGALVAENNTDYTTKQVRNIILIADGEEIPAGANGDICLVYEA